MRQWLTKAKNWGWLTLFLAIQSVSQSVSLKVLKDFWKVKVDTREGRSGKTQVSMTWSLPQRGFQANVGDRPVDQSVQSSWKAP